MNKKIKFAAILTRTHKWIGLLVGLQLVMWTVGGFIMAVFPIETVRSEAMIAEPQILPEQLDIPVNPQQAINAAKLENVIGMRLESFAGEPVWRLQAKDESALVSAITGKSLLPLSKETAQKIILQDYSGNGKIITLERVEKGPVEVRFRGPLWRAEFSEPKNYTVWADIEEGRIIAHRSSVWRLFDFFWMLHIMDYGDRDDFNNPLLVFFAFSASIFSLTGISLLVHRFLLRPRPRRKNKRQP